MFKTCRYTRLISGGRKRALVAAAMTLFFACCLMVPPAGTRAAQASDPPSTPVYDQNPASEQKVEVVIDGEKVVIPDVILRDQEGRKIRFHSDLIKGKVVVLSFFYTSCTYICNIQGRLFSELQSLLGERLGKSVFLISVTTDPATDKPEQLKAWGQRDKVKPGWTLATGEEAEINKLLTRLTGRTAGRTMHSAVTFLVNDRRGVWIGTEGFYKPEDFLKEVDDIARDNADRLK
jgi:cytochrome oxidase Cu insertion factor (SCO1/SenC/PrrC family)